MKNIQQASIIDLATSILVYRSRFLPRTWPRASTLTTLDTLALGVLGGESELRMIHVQWYTSAHNVRVSSRTSSNRTKSSMGPIQISSYTSQTKPFHSGCGLLMRIEDDWCRKTQARPRPRARLGKCLIGPLSAVGCQCYITWVFNHSIHAITHCVRARLQVRVQHPIWRHGWPGWSAITVFPIPAQL